MKDSTMKSANRSNIFLKFKNSTSFGIALILIGLCVILTVAVGGSFLSTDNLLSVFRQFSFTAIMAIGMCMVIITGGIDLSSGSVFAFAGVVGSMAIAVWGWSTPLGLLLGCAAGAGFGLLNGMLVAKVNLPAFIATLGSMSIARGLSYGITSGYPINDLPIDFKFIGQGYIAGIPAPIILLIALIIVFGIFLHKSVIGRRIYAVGGNEEATRVSGVRVDRIKMLVYTLSGLLAGLSGLATAARLGVAQSTAGQGMEMDAIAAVIIGGASLSGGVGNIAAPILGAAIMGVLRNGLVLLSVSAYWQQVVIGVVIIVAVTIDKMRYAKR